MSTEIEVAILPKCDFCHLETFAVYDTKTFLGPWANMCAFHFSGYGVGLGTGLGQRLILKEKK